MPRSRMSSMIASARRHCPARSHADTSIVYVRRSRRAYAARGSCGLLLQLLLLLVILAAEEEEEAFVYERVRDTLVVFAPRLLREGGSGKRREKERYRNEET